MKRALLVEDNLLNRELLRTMLEGSGWAVDEADNGAEALRMLEKSLPDVVLTDLQMPVMGGLAFLKEVRKQPRLARLTVFAVSAYAMQGDRERALAEGFDGYVTKPIEWDEFHEQMGRLFAMPDKCEAIIPEAR
jgi:CheY-like chemotaxis protein